MSNNLKKWQEIESIIKKSHSNKSVLLGNGFSIAWDNEKFNQGDLLKELSYLSELQEINVEKCIEKLTDLKCNDTKIEDTAKQIINNKINADFMRVFFEKLPKQISHEKSLPFVNFLNLFNQYFTLNYDPLLYFMANKFKENKKNTTSAKKTNINNAQEQELADFEQEVNSILDADWIIQSGDTEFYREKITTETHNFIKNKLVTLLKDKNQNKQYFTSNGTLKKPFKEKLNQQITIKKEIKVEDSLRKLNFSDGFNHEKSDNRLKWKESNSCNTFYLHGAFHIIQDNNETIKITATDKKGMMEEIYHYLDTGNNPITILDGTTKAKKQKIDANSYLKHSYSQLTKTEGILLTLGVNFSDNDAHIIQAIKENSKLNKIYLGIFDDGKNALEIPSFFDDIKDKIEIFETNNVFLSS